MEPYEGHIWRLKFSDPIYDLLGEFAACGWKIWLILLLTGQWQEKQVTVKD